MSLLLLFIFYIIPLGVSLAALAAELYLISHDFNLRVSIFKTVRPKCVAIFTVASFIPVFNVFLAIYGFNNTLTDFYRLWNKK